MKQLQIQVSSKEEATKIFKQLNKDEYSLSLIMSDSGSYVYRTRLPNFVAEYKDLGKYFDYIVGGKCVFIKYDDTYQLFQKIDKYLMNKYPKSELKTFSVLNSESKGYTF